MRKCFLENLPKKKIGKKDVIDWNKSIGYDIDFIYDNIKGVFNIFDKEGEYVYIKYNEQEFKMLTSSIARCSMGKVVGVFGDKFKIDIGARLQDENRDIVITDREYRYENNKKLKYYNYKCNKCGWTEGWILESNLINRKSGCAACCPTPRVVVEGINDIPTTAPWMVKYFQGGYDEAKLYTRGSGKKINPVCSECGNVGNKTAIKSLYEKEVYLCIKCSDGISFPEKVLYKILTYLNVNFEFQYKRDWSNGKVYDFYFKYKDTDFIIETHGEQHYRNTGGRYKNVDKVKENDKYKKNLAIKNGIQEINYIVLDCSNSSIDWIKDKVLKSRLANIFDLSKVDWCECRKFAASSMVKQTCDYWNNVTKDINIIAKEFKLSYNTVLNYLKQGSDLGWCKYDAVERAERCNDNKKKKIICLENNIIFNSIKECSNKSVETFGVYLHTTGISAVCNGKNEHTKGYRFKFLEEESE